MSFTLGWFAQNVTLSIAFLMLGAIYGGGVLAAVRVRTLSSPAKGVPDGDARGEELLTIFS